MVSRIGSTMTQYRRKLNHRSLSRENVLRNEMIERVNGDPNTASLGSRNEDNASRENILEKKITMTPTP